MKPKTPLPWRHLWDGKTRTHVIGAGEIGLVYGTSALGVGEFPMAAEDAAYAVRAANVLPEVTAALRLMIDAYENAVKDANIDVGRYDPAETARAALAKAEDAGEVGE